MARSLIHCFVCGKQFESKGTLPEHQRALGAGKGTFKTERCPGSGQQPWGNPRQ